MKILKNVRFWLVNLAVTLAATASENTPDLIIIDLTQLDRPPVVIWQESPKYPPDLKKQDITGDVIVDFVVDAQGKVQAAKAVKFSHSGFRKAAVEAVSKWKFRAGVKNGKPVNTRMQAPILFR